MTIAAGLALGGCAIGPDYQEPALPVTDRFTAQREPGLEAAEPRSERWWQNFNDPVLDELVSRADIQNINLRRSLLAPSSSASVCRSRFFCSRAPSPAFSTQPSRSSAVSGRSAAVSPCWSSGWRRLLRPSVST